MDGLKPELADGIRMFKPKSLKEAISLARMKDDQIHKQSKGSHQNTQSMTDSASSVINHASSMKRLSWDEMQRRRAQGLCFNCDTKFSVGHKCHEPQLLMLEGKQQLEEEPGFNLESSLHSLQGLLSKSREPSGQGSKKGEALIGLHFIYHVTLSSDGIKIWDCISYSVHTCLQLGV